MYFFVFFGMFSYRLSQAIRVSTVWISSTYLILIVWEFLKGTVTTTFRTAKCCSSFMCLEPTCNGVAILNCTIWQRVPKACSLLGFSHVIVCNCRLKTVSPSQIGIPTTKNGVEKHCFGCVFPMQEAFADLAGMAKKNDLEASHLFLQCVVRQSCGWHFYSLWPKNWSGTCSDC